MEPVVLLGGVILVTGAVWSVCDLLEESSLAAAVKRRTHCMRLTKVYSAFKSRDINSSTACRAGLSPYKIS